MDEMVTQVDLHKNAVYVVKDGKIEIIDSPPTGYGKQTISWESGKPTRVDFNFSKRII